MLKRHNHKEGWLRHQGNIAKPAAKRKRDSAQPKEKPTRPRGFSSCIHRKTTPASRLADASRYFIDRSATPPCFDARRGLRLTPAQFLKSSCNCPAARPITVRNSGGVKVS